MIAPDGPARVARGMAWTMGSALTQMVLQVATLATLGRLLTPADFGVVAAALVVVNFSTIFAQFGVNQAIVQRRELPPRIAGTAFAVSVVLAVALSSGVWAGAPGLAALLQLPELAGIIRALAALFVLRALGATSEALLARALRFRALALVDVVSYGIGYGAVGIAVAASGGGVWALVGAQLAQASVKTAVTLTLQRHTLRPDLSRAVIGDLVRFGGGHSLARIANFVALQADNLVVARGLGAAALGAYSRAYQLMGMPAGLVGQAIDRVLFPSLSRLQDDRRALRVAYLRGAGLIALLTVPTGAVMAALAPEVVGLVLGAQWSEVVPPFQVFALTMVFRVSDRLNAVVARATAAVYRRAALQVVYAACVIVFATAALPFGVRGVAQGVALALVTNHLLSTALSLRIVAAGWRDALSAVATALPLTLLAGGAAVATAAGLRSVDAPGPVTLTLALAVAAALAAAAVARWPRYFLGPEATWIAHTATSLLPTRRRRGPPGPEGTA